MLQTQEEFNKIRREWMRKRYGHSPRKDINAEKYKRFIILYADPANTYKKIAEELKLSIKTVYAWSKKVLKGKQNNARNRLLLNKERQD